MQEKMLRRFHGENTVSTLCYSTNPAVPLRIVLCGTRPLRKISAREQPERGKPMHAHGLCIFFRLSPGRARVFLHREKSVLWNCRPLSLVNWNITFEIWRVKDIGAKRDSLSRVEMSSFFVLSRLFSRIQRLVRQLLTGSQSRECDNIKMIPRRFALCPVAPPWLLIVRNR